MASQFKSFLVRSGKKFHLKDFSTDDTGSLRHKEAGQARLQECISRLVELQGRLYAANQWSVLLIFQAMDAAGKDSAIKHVMSGLNPQGCQVSSFKAPSSEELDHDFLWRCQQKLPERGRIGIFNRSYYEETLVVRVHPEILAKENLPDVLMTKHLWRERFEDIRAFERHLARNGTIIRKFFLNVSRREQKERFLARLNEPEKNWKFSALDVQERALWPKYMSAYEETIRHTATPEAPWLVVPADHKWFSRVVVAEALIDALESVELRYPEVTPLMRKEQKKARQMLKTM
jgi:PPK2 family polyphosphate:nucleotide phosphotransferase